ncbi:hypothetical protein [Chryseobacterium indologenes]|uniref:hypothetical protein n=1 Tax=Chryseobacterium indologenes TaxID=253 RepID=UPI0030192601
MEKAGVTGSAVNELEVSEREYEHRLRAKKNLDKMKNIESTWIRVNVNVQKGTIWCFYKPIKKRK